MDDKSAQAAYGGGSSPDGNQGDDIEGRLMEVLKYGGLDKENLATLVRTASGFHGSGLRIVKAFPYGIINPDGILVEYFSEVDTLPTILDRLVRAGHVHTVKIFPKGVLELDHYVAEVVYQ